MRFGIARICTDSLADHWSKAKGLELAGIDSSQKVDFLAELAFHMQSSASHEEMGKKDAALEISRDELELRLKAFLKREDGQVLAAAVELAEELPGARAMVDSFFALGKDVSRKMVHVSAGPFQYGRPPRELRIAAFEMDVVLVTNADFEAMVPVNAKLRNGYSSEPDQPVI